MNETTANMVQARMTTAKAQRTTGALDKLIGDGVMRRSHFGELDTEEQVALVHLRDQLKEGLRAR